jgi:saccharopine dehydrogenase (NAD+, L-lysine forming)
MNNTIGILREAINKKGEKRVAVTPAYAAGIVQKGHKLIVQPAKNPKTGEIKRAFEDEEYIKSGAEINEDLSHADVIFGLKEIPVKTILPEKAYLLFSHTYKGQLKNRDMLKTFIDLRTTIIDYELIRDESNHRLITAFTYNAGYAGMVDTLWTLGQRLNVKGIENPFEVIPQAIEGEDLQSIKDLIAETGKIISDEGTPKEIPPVITCFLGRGKTSSGAQQIYDLLPVEEITFDQLEEVYLKGSRNKVYKLILTINEMYRLKAGEGIDKEVYLKLNKKQKRQHYLMNPEFYESNLDKMLPYITVLMNCILWDPKYPRALPKSMIKDLYGRSNSLTAIGDITCDPNGSIEFSKETWIDDPVYVFNPLSETVRMGFEGEGVAVMSVTNLPCEFSADASRQFSRDLSSFLEAIISADYHGDIDKSGLPPEIKRAVLIWKGEFTDDFFYMKNYIA